MIDIYKFITGKDDINCSVKLQLHPCTVPTTETRGNMYKSVPDRHKYEWEKLCILKILSSMYMEQSA